MRRASRNNRDPVVSNRYVTVDWQNGNRSIYDRKNTSAWIQAERFVEVKR